MDDLSMSYLEKYLATCALDSDGRQSISCSSGCFCADEASANICSDLIRRGVKMAGCSMKYWYESGKEPMPRVGHLHVVTDWSGEPTCIIEITSVSECRFCDVDDAFAIAEGEGDKTLDWWRKAHWAFFSQECKEEGIEPSRQMGLIKEWFKVVYPNPS